MGDSVEHLFIVDGKIGIIGCQKSAFQKMLKSTRVDSSSPGLIDMHVIAGARLCSQGKNDLRRRGVRRRGGFTTSCCMPKFTGGRYRAHHQGSDDAACDIRAWQVLHPARFQKI